MRLAVVGSRTFTDYELMFLVLDLYAPTVIISGGAKGADTLARRFALANDIELREYPAEWDKYGKSAGFRRNKFIVDDCDAIVVFFGPEGESRGASHTLGLAKDAGKPWAVYYQEEEDD